MFECSSLKRRAHSTEDFMGTPLRQLVARNVHAIEQCNWPLSYSCYRDLARRGFFHELQHVAFQQHNCPLAIIWHHWHWYLGQVAWRRSSENSRPCSTMLFHR